MSIAGKLIIATLVALLASLALSALHGAGLLDPMTLALTLAATVASVLLTHRPLAPPVDALSPPGVERSPRTPTDKKPEVTATSGVRRTGAVKWFNAAKGFGFITVDDGEEVFVHFRSIRGEGRRTLKDGQRVSFVIEQTQKGPQAEDVDPGDA